MSKEELRSGHELYAELLVERNQLRASVEAVQKEYSMIVNALQGKVPFREGAKLIDMLLGYVHSLEAENKNFRESVCKETPEMATRERVLTNGNGN